MKDFSEFGNPPQNRIDYQFIVVYDKSTKRYAKSLSNQAVSQNIKSTTWNTKQYEAQESSLTNYNHTVFLSDSLINDNLGNPNLPAHNLIPGVLYKYEGHSLGIYLDPKADYVEIAKKVAKRLSENDMNPESFLSNFRGSCQG